MTTEIHHLTVSGIKVEVVNKGKIYLNKLMETYIESELDKQQQKGKNTIAFITLPSSAMLNPLPTWPTSWPSSRRRLG